MQDFFPFFPDDSIVSGSHLSGGDSVGLCLNNRIKKSITACILPETKNGCLFSP